jgi:thiamine-monophosphate kinase
MSPTGKPPEPVQDRGGEFALIARHFVRPGSPASPGLALGIGDDCALLTPSPGHQFAISSDMLVEGRHFFPGVDPESLGHKALAVNLSDLAAMGARPLGFTLALSLPSVEDSWLAAFAKGLFALADRHGCPLVGGDTTRGPLNICITVFGELLPGRALRRAAAEPGDDIYVSGNIGEARLALEHLRASTWATAALPSLPKRLRDRLERPTPRLGLGQALLGVAHAAIDLSDGLAGDLGHILQASGVGAELRLADWPLTAELKALPEPHRLECLLNGGDDYELLFTAPPSVRAVVDQAATSSATPVHRVGLITQAGGLRLIDANGAARPWTARSYDHFA